MEVESLPEEQHRSHPDVLRQNDDESFGLVKNGALGLKLSPSVLCRKIVCPAYLAAPFDPESRLRFLGLHAMAMLQVIKRHIQQGFRLLSVEKYVNGSRIDLEFQKPNGGVRLNEVKSKRELGEVDKIQAALYSNGSHDEVVLSNSQRDVMLSPEYIEEVRQRAEATRTLLLDHADIAARSYKPSHDICRHCANHDCPFLPGRMALKETVPGA